VGKKMVRNKVNELKKIILELAYTKKEGHIAPSFSVLDILYVLYYKIVDLQHDKVILSKGHASLALYVILYSKGIISKEELYSFCDYNSQLGGHPKLNIPLGINASTGSLGHGLPIAIGLALSKKIKCEEGNVYCIIGDGEANEGSIYESLLLGSQHNLNNLYLIVDNNQSINNTLSLGSFEDKVQSFGWNVSSIVGHNFCDLETYLRLQSEKPQCIVAHTIKGHGIKQMENDPQKWHHAFPNDKEYHEMLEELTYEKTVY
jgi:transketolase